MAVDLAKAFETVYRPLLVREALAIGYPPECLLLGLSLYAMPRRLVYRQCVSRQLVPHRGIVAGSAFATNELEVVMWRSLDRLEAQDRSVLWSVQVDDITATVLYVDKVNVYIY